MKEKIKTAFDQVYSKVIGKKYRDQMIKQNESHITYTLNAANISKDEVNVFLTSHAAYRENYEKFIKLLRPNSELHIKNDLKDIFAIKLCLLFFISLFFVCELVFVGFLTSLVSIDKKYNIEAFFLTGILFLIFSFLPLFMLKNFNKNLFKKINLAEFEKGKISSFFFKYKTAIALNDKTLFYVSQPLNQEENEIHEIEYSAIKKVFLSSQDEIVEFKIRRSADSLEPMKTLVETDDYKDAKFKVLNLLMPDDVILSVIDPVGPNGENVEELRDIIESRRLGEPINVVNNSIQSVNKMTV